MSPPFSKMKRRIRKFRRHPERYCSESRISTLRAFGAFLRRRPKLEERLRSVLYAPQDHLAGLVASLHTSIPKSAPALTLDVIIPCHNNDATVEEAIRSVLNQTVPATNVIVVDDGSRDRSRSIVRRIAETDSRVKLYVLDENKGVAHARNVGLSRAVSRFVAFQDADDIAHPMRFEAQFRWLTRQEAIAVTCDGCRMVQGKAVEVDGHYYHELPVSVLFERQPVLQAVGFMRKMTIGEDVDYLCRMKASFGEARIGHLWRCLYFAAMRPGSAIHAHGEMREVEAGRYVYLPRDETRAVLDGIPVWNAEPANLFVPFEDTDALLISCCDAR